MSNQEKKLNYHYRMLSFVKDNGMRIVGKIFYPEMIGQKDAKFPAIIFSHGLGVTYRDLEHYGPWFAERGVACLVYDFCGGSMDSESDGETIFMSLKTEQDDLRAVLRDVRDMADKGQLPVDSSKIFLMGESQGAYVSTLLGAENPQCCAGLILWYAAFCLQDMATEWKKKAPYYKRSLWRIPLGRNYTEEAYNIPIYDVIASYKGPAILVHGDMDPIVALSYSERAEKTFDNASLFVVQGGKHGFEGDLRWQAAGASLDFVRANA